MVQTNYIVVFVQVSGLPQSFFKLVGPNLLTVCPLPYEGTAMTYTHPAPTATDTARMAAATKNRLGGSRIAGIVRAWHAIDARCTLCETVTTYDGDAGDRPVFGHLTPASVLTPGAAAGQRGGYTADNGVLMCADCNYAISDTPAYRLAYRPTYLGTFPRVTRVARVDTHTGKSDKRAALGY